MSRILKCWRNFRSAKASFKHILNQNQSEWLEWMGQSGLTTDRAFTARICCVHKRPRIEVRIQTLHKHWASVPSVFGQLFCLNVVQRRSQLFSLHLQSSYLCTFLAIDESSSQLQQIIRKIKPSVAAIHIPHRSAVNVKLNARRHSHWSWHSA